MLSIRAQPAENRPQVSCVAKRNNHQSRLQVVRSNKRRHMSQQPTAWRILNRCRHRLKVRASRRFVCKQTACKPIFFCGDRGLLTAATTSCLCIHWRACIYVGSVCIFFIGSTQAQPRCTCSLDPLDHAHCFLPCGSRAPSRPNGPREPHCSCGSAGRCL
jgi:hypothetical protein